MRTVVRTLENAERIAGEVVKLFRAHADRGLMVTIDIYERPSSNSQKAKIHAMIADLADETGYTRIEMKEIVKHHYYPVKTIKLKKSEISVPKSTAELSNDEASVIIERLYHVAAQAGITLKDK